MRRFPPKNFTVDKAGRGMCAGGQKLKLTADGMIYSRETGKQVGMVVDGDLDYLFRLSGRGLDNALSHYI